MNILNYKQFKRQMSHFMSCYANPCRFINAEPAWQPLNVQALLNTAIPSLELSLAASVHSKVVSKLPSRFCLSFRGSDLHTCPAATQAGCAGGAGGNLEHHEQDFSHSLEMTIDWE